MREPTVRSLGQEDSPGGKNAIHSNILARIIPWTEEPDGLTVHGVAKSGTRLSDLITHARSLG